MNDVVITVTAEDRMHLERILLDRDSEAALTFLNHMKERIENGERKGMRSHLDSK